jgi:hypothetical protein
VEPFVLAVRVEDFVLPVPLVVFRVLAFGVWDLAALGAWAFGALALGPADAGFADVGLIFGPPFLAMAGTAAMAMDSAAAAAVRNRSEYFIWFPPDPRRADEIAPHGS